jgi:zinc protease
MKTFHYLILVVLIGIVSCTGSKYKTQQFTDPNGYPYEAVTNDPAGLRIYSLENGLKVYLSVNKAEPRIMTFITVRAGSNNDPEETTGLAHYFEHLMFKGTSSYGTIDWEKEKPLLDSISALYELHLRETDSLKRLDIYKQIDKLSIKAAEYAIPNEYDRMVTDFGAQNTNAFTSNELTAYMNDIPANELRKWLALEANRFDDIALRLFHTELETVYEEFNMYQDRDRSRAMKAFNKAMFPTHPTGRDVIGYPEHLKNPSWVNIMSFKDTWYVPNNMAICLSGDLDPDETILMIDETFGKFESKPIPELPVIVEEPITEPVVKEIFGPDAESLLMGYRCGGEHSADKRFIYLISNILYNGQAGLMDINLIQEQKILSGFCYAGFEGKSGYGNLFFRITPKSGQTLEEAKDLVLGEIEKIKEGDFPDWIPEAIANQYRLDFQRRFQDNWRAFDFLDAFILDKKWEDELNFPDMIEHISKEDIMAFANDFFQDNYVVVYKREGKAKGLVKVKKPPLTPITINRDDESVFYTEWKKIPADTILPEFVDFEATIHKTEFAEGVDLYYIKNDENELFTHYYLVDVGKNHNLKIPLAVRYLPFLGTQNHSPAELKEELFRYGLYTNVYSSNDRSYVYISGLNRNYEKGLELMEEILNSSVADTSSYRKYAEGIVKRRNDAKMNQGNILWNGLLNYAMYGKVSSFTDIIPNDALFDIDPDDLTALSGTLCDYPHRIVYYGPDEPEAVESVVSKYHQLPEAMNPIPEEKVYPELDMDKNYVLVADYDMSQANFIMLSKGVPYSEEVYLGSQLFNQYFGNSMASIVFQEVREARGMAYSAWAGYYIPVRPDRSCYIRGFVGTQVDKLGMATETMNNLLIHLIEDRNSLDISKRAIQNTIATERIIRTDLFFRWLRYHDLGIDRDIRKDIFEMMETATMEDLRNFFDTYIRDNPYAYLVVGNVNDMDMEVLNSLGDVRQVSLEEIFGY